MRVLLVTATSFEIAPFLKINKNIEILICGVGIPDTIYHLTKKLLKDNYDIVIQAGIAGTFTKKLKKGEVVLVKQDAFADIGVEEKGSFKTVFELGFADKNKFPFKNGWLVNPHELLQRTHLRTVNAVTVNRISDRRKQARQISKNFSPDIETMEGAALQYVCLQMNIPFLQIRSISNKVSERNKDKWKLIEAIENLNIQLLKLIQTYHNA